MNSQSQSNSEDALKQLHDESQQFYKLRLTRLQEIESQLDPDDYFEIDVLIKRWPHLNPNDMFIVDVKLGYYHWRKHTTSKDKSTYRYMIEEGDKFFEA